MGSLEKVKMASSSRTLPIYRSILKELKTVYRKVQLDNILI